MAVVRNFVCDGCNKIVSGKDRAADVHRNYIHIFGYVTQYEYQRKEGSYHRSSFLDEKTNLTFCDASCFQTWIETMAEVRPVEAYEDRKEFNGYDSRMGQYTGGQTHKWRPDGVMKGANDKSFLPDV